MRRNWKISREKMSEPNLTQYTEGVAWMDGGKEMIIV
jgi:hypothetical protein